MWPKALAQLVELAPHIVRMVPMADRFFQSKTASEEASRVAMEAMAAGLRGDLGQVTASHVGLYRQLNVQSEKLASVSAEVRSVKLVVDAFDARLARIEKSQATQQGIAILGLLLLVAVAVLIFVFRHG